MVNLELSNYRESHAIANLVKHSNKMQHILTYLNECDRIVAIQKRLQSIPMAFLY